MRSAPPQTPPAEKRRNLALWAGFWAALAAWAVHFQVVYALTPYVCERGGLPLLHAASAACLLVITGGLWLSWRNWRSVGGGEPTPEDEGVVARVRLLSTLGLMAGLLFALVTIAQWLSILLLKPCPP